MPEATEISNPRRILAVSLDDATHHLGRVVKDLTGSIPVQTSTSLAGTTHDLPLSTTYYTATVPIWLDLISSPAEWASSFLSPEASEVLAVLGGVVVIFGIPDEKDAGRTRELVTHMGKVVKDGLGGWEWDGVALAVGVADTAGDVDEWDDLCADAGLEFVHVTSGSGTGRNEFGEKTGIPRVKEALEANDWAQVGGDGLSDFGDFKDPLDDSSDDGELDPENLDFGFDRADFDGLRKAIWQGGEGAGEEADASEKPALQSRDGVTVKEGDDDVSGLGERDIAKVESMMRKLQAVREAGEGMGEEQRRRMAARAVDEVMKEL